MYFDLSVGIFDSCNVFIRQYTMLTLMFML